MKTLSTPLFPFLEKHSESYTRNHDVQENEVNTLGNLREISLLLKTDSLVAPSETSINIIMDYARLKKQ